MHTKRYTVVIAGLMPDIVTQGILIRIWGKAAQKVYASTGIYVNAQLNGSYFLCGDKRESELDGLTANFIIIWNPVEVESAENFHKAFTQVVNGVRELLDNPYVWVTIEEIEFFYFIKC
ncbi:MAG: hypothetical protein ACLTXE_08895 [Enterocloster aldenensis]